MNRTYPLIIMMILMQALICNAAPAIALTDAVQGKGPVADTVIIQRDPAVDSTLVGLSVYDLINNGQGGGEAEIFLNRSESVDYAFKKYIEQNAQKKLNGFRIRIFFDNKQSARAQSEEVEKIFIETFPQYPVYRTYTNPYFKVAVGDFRTKSDAMKVLQVIQKDFPKAFIIKDIINYPL